MDNTTATMPERCTFAAFGIRCALTPMHDGDHQMPAPLDDALLEQDPRAASVVFQAIRYYRGRTTGTQLRRIVARYLGDEAPA